LEGGEFSGSGQFARGWTGLQGVAGICRGRGSLQGVGEFAVNGQWVGRISRGWEILQRLADVCRGRRSLQGVWEYGGRWESLREAGGLPWVGCLQGVGGEVLQRVGVGVCRGGGNLQGVREFGGAGEFAARGGTGLQGVAGICRGWGSLQ